MITWTRLALLTAAVSVLFSAGGCSALILYAGSVPGRDTPPQPRLSLTRDQVDADLGKPITTTPLPDGGQVATYQYRRPDPAAREKARDMVGVHAALWAVFRQGGPALSVLVEPVLTGIAIYRVAHPPHGEVTLTFDAYGRLLEYGPPPSYGPPEEAVEGPSVGKIRRSCWPESAAVGTSSAIGSEAPRPADRGYVECVTRKLAMWGLD